MNRTDRQTAASTGRLRLAQLLAFLGLLAALVGALGPAERVRTSYSWPPETLPEGTPERVWYTPLLLTRQRPEALRVTLPCMPPPALVGASSPVRVLATARRPVRAGGLAITRAGNRVTISVADRVLDRVPLSGPRDDECAYSLRFGVGGWSLEGGPAEIERGGMLDEPPVVFGLFSELDLRASPPLTVEVVTAVHATRTITRQVVAWTLAVLAILGALALAAFERRPRMRSTLGVAVRSAVRRADPADAVVGATLVGWWILSPAFFDDGWVMTRQSMFSSSRGFSAYYNTFATNGPLSYELDWLLHWLSQTTSVLLYLRVPALLCLAVTWLLCRWVLSRILAASVGPSRLALWTLAGAFLVGALAWGMTLRTEPVSALLVAIVLAAVVRFLEREDVAALAGIALVVPFALTSHPEGTATLAPLLAAAPSLLGWARSRLAIVSPIAASSIALFAVLAFLGSDLEQRQADAETTGRYGLTVAWRFELIRYTSLADYPWGTPLRRAAVALIAIAVLAFVLWGRNRGRSLLGLPATASAIALVLFVATPSKHPWHFGALLGLAAVAVACETARFRADAADADRSWARPLLVAVAMTVLIAWAWAPRQQWNALDLRTLDWNHAYEKAIPIATIAAALPLVLIAGALLRGRIRGRRGRLGLVSWRVAALSALLLAVPLLVFTTATIAVDAARTSSWTLARQNLGSLTGDAGCGLADDMSVAVPREPQQLELDGGAESPGIGDWMPDAPVAGVRRFALGPSDAEVASTPWFDVTDEPIGVFVAGRHRPSELELEGGRRGEGGRVEHVGSELVPEDYAAELGGTLPWRLVLPAQSDLLAREVDAIRVTLRPERAGAAVAVTSPVSYAMETFTSMARQDGLRTLVLPNLLAYFPCHPAPRLGDGIVDVPDHVVTTRDGAWVIGDRDTSPFSGLFDLYRLWRLPMATPDLARTDLAVLVVDRRIPGASVLPPAKTTVRS